MPGYVFIVDLLGLVLALVGFHLAFRQGTIRRHHRRPVRPRDQEQNDGGDPMTYIMRIAGVMMMVFGTVIAAMVTYVAMA
jgi:uncharacterized membrane protein YidH (DUF202 family)